MKIELLVQAPEQPDREDGGRALILEPEVLTGGDAEFFVRLQSWTETPSDDAHALLRSLRGRRLRIVIEDADASEGDATVDPLRAGVQQLTTALREGEWADLLTTDSDLADLAEQIGALVERVYPPAALNETGDPRRICVGGCAEAKEGRPACVDVCERTRASGGQATSAEGAVRHPVEPRDRIALVARVAKVQGVPLPPAWYAAAAKHGVPIEGAPAPGPVSDAVHFAHCYQGEYEGVCKYGDENCPARVDAPTSATSAIETDDCETLLDAAQYLREHNLTSIAWKVDAVRRKLTQALEEPKRG